MLRGASFYSLGRLGPRAEALLKPEPNPYSRKLQVLQYVSLNQSLHLAVGIHKYNQIKQKPGNPGSEPSGHAKPYRLLLGFLQSTDHFKFRGILNPEYAAKIPNSSKHKLLRPRTDICSPVRHRFLKVTAAMLSDARGAT